nr:hypothetical protein GCM10020241_16500 [Streptoalloteichus tenebrarius]
MAGFGGEAAAHQVDPLAVEFAPQVAGADVLDVELHAAALEVLAQRGPDGAEELHGELGGATTDLLIISCSTKDQGGPRARLLGCSRGTPHF